MSDRLSQERGEITKIGAVERVLDDACCALEATEERDRALRIGYAGALRPIGAHAEISDFDRWRDLVARVQTRGTFARTMPIRLEVRLVAACWCELSVVLGNVVDARPLLPDGGCDARGAVTFTCTLPDAVADCPEDRMIQFVRDAVQKALAHELDECLLLDGQMIHDPHSESGTPEP